MLLLLAEIRIGLGNAWLIGIIPGIKYGRGVLTNYDLVRWLKIIYAFQLFYITSVSVVKFSM